MKVFIAIRKFPLGRIVATPNALAHVSEMEMGQSLARHESGDWGDVDPEDRGLNDQALVEGSRLFSVYHTTGNVKFWIITEWDRSATTVLLPADY
jgi:hypothetical protein